MAGTKELKRRIKSVKSTKKITRAMQMVSAAKMRRAQNAVLASRTYADLAWEIINNLSDKVDPKYHPLLAQNDKGAIKGKLGIILITSNGGMIGSFNSNLLNTLNKYIAKYTLENNAEVINELVVLGRKGRDATLRLGKTIAAEFPKADRQISISEILPISKLITEQYIKGHYSKIVVIYTDFISTITQKPVVKQLLPFVPHDSHHTKQLPTTDQKKHYEYLFEPDPGEVLDYLVPRIVESQIYQAVLESDASEHSARMVAMKNATDAASDLIEDLTLTYNQLRQANITQELAEITAGRIALE